MTDDDCIGYDPADPKSETKEALHAKHQSGLDILDLSKKILTGLRPANFYSLGASASLPYLIGSFLPTSTVERT